MSSGWACSGAGSGIWTVMMSPARAGVLGLAGLPFTRMSSDLSSAWMRARVSSGSSEHRYLSSRCLVVSCTVIFMMVACFYSQWGLKK